MTVRLEPSGAPPGSSAVSQDHRAEITLSHEISAVPSFFKGDKRQFYFTEVSRTEISIENLSHLKPANRAPPCFQQAVGTWSRHAQLLATGSSHPLVSH